MKATLIERRRIVMSDEAFAEVAIWRVPVPVPASQHAYKYRLAYVEREICLLRYDNERGKGDHRHSDGKEAPYEFSDIDTLIDDFFRDIARLKP